MIECSVNKQIRMGGIIFMHQTYKHGFSWSLFILMGSVTFMAILSELMPSGVLPEMAAGFGITEAQAGGFVGQYAIASAIFGIPIVSAPVEWDRKKLLMLLLVGFAIANIIVGLTSVYWLAVIARIAGGICAGVLWPMISAYGMSCPARIRGGSGGDHGGDHTRDEYRPAHHDLDRCHFWFPYRIYCHGNLHFHYRCAMSPLLTSCCG